MYKGEFMDYKRILLKLSGEALGTKESTLSKDVLNDLLNQIKFLQENKKIEIAIVVGGGNIFRGKISSDLGMGEDTSLADYMGMMATSINALGISTFLENNGIPSIFQNSLKFEKISKGLNKKEAKKALSNGKVVVFGGGTGEPYLSTDTAASMRAVEINADAILMAKNNVDGVYTADPLKDKSAKHISEILFDEIIDKNFKVIDQKALEILKGKNIDIILFNMNKKDNIINLYENPKTKKTIIKEK